MADSIKKRIADNIVTDLKNITTANGYEHNFPAGNVLFAKEITEIPDQTEPALLVDILNTQVLGDEAHTIREDYVYMVRAYLLHDDENTDLNEDNGNIEADIIKALKVDTTRGGLAHYTRKGDCGPGYDVDVGQPYYYVLIHCETTVNGTDPYST